ncbi:Serum amyloid A-1 protein [Myotis brandtii]|uniref:Serum amyloid A-1 protein n=1 Tax=Myotis brandtii TaxID=109478 RepID=S7NLS6_MYOBR|nr:Serum amyloid A-1 protein [Myotis brandtii]
MKLSTIIVFCCLLLGVSSQGWRTFLREAGQGKDPSMGLEEAASDPAQVSPEQRPHSHKRRSRLGRTLFSRDFREAYPRLTDLVKHRDSGHGLEDRMADQEANRWGRSGKDPNRFRPPGLPAKY